MGCEKQSHTLMHKTNKPMTNLKARPGVTASTAQEIRRGIIGTGTWPKVEHKTCPGI